MTRNITSEKFNTIEKETQEEVWNFFDRDPFIQNFYLKVLTAIEQIEILPDTHLKESESVKEGMKHCWKRLVKNSEFEVAATDQDARPYLVILQGIIEQTLARQLRKSIKSLTGVIHAPLPCTPLCTEGKISAGLLDVSIEKDPLRLFTVKSRATILGDYIHQGGDLYIVYPRIGISKRTRVQRNIYNNELKKFFTLV